MRVLISKAKKINLLNSLKNKYDTQNIEELSKKLKIKKKTLEGWIYVKERCIPFEFVFQHAPHMEIEKKENNWGQILGGKIGHKKLIEKYGEEKVKIFNSRGGQKAALTKERRIIPLDFNLEDDSFLELYGALIGDGWLSSLKKESMWALGLCGHLKLDRLYIEYLAKIVDHLLQRKGYFSERLKYNVIEFRFRHKQFFKFLTEELNFPMGKKENLIIHSKIFSLGYKKTRYVIRGIFDTDGSFYLEKNKKGISNYPCLSIHMKEPLLLEQLFTLLKEEGFRVSFDRTNNQIKLKGKEQLNKWLNEIGSSNPSKLNQMLKNARVAQPG